MLKRVLRNIFSFIVLLVAGLTIYQVISINILPDKYLYLFLGAEGILFLLGLLLYNLKHKFFIVLGILLYLINIAGNGVAAYYIGKMNHYIDNNFAVETYTLKTHYYVIASVNDGIDSIDSFNKDTEIYYYTYSRAVGKAKQALGDFTYTGVDNAFEALDSVSRDHKYFLIPNGSYDYIIDASRYLEEDDFRILYEFDVEQEIEKNKEVPDAYNVYINGLDFTGLTRDFNLIATINTKTHKVVLTSIPRDYYIDVPAYNMKDTLMCMGALDSEVSKEALEKLFDIHIDYTININANTVVQIVDALGGIEFCSDYEFKTSTPTTGSFYINKGCKTYDGNHILGIARYRMTLPGRDRSRQKNMRTIMISIVKKLASMTTITNYDEILNSFDGLYTTDMNKETITNLVKEGIKDKNFEIIEQSVDGNDGIGVGHLGTQESWIMTPDMNTVHAATKQINEILEEE